MKRVKQLKKHIISKCIVILLSIVLVIPLIVKLNHVFENHEHEVCTNSQTTHLHKLDLDCEFYKFKLQTQTYENEYVYRLHTNSDIQKPVVVPFSNCHPTIITSFHLRGPPGLI